ncbi:hypothetical protein SMACR_09543 [Sordaria macrospora]|uniref:WGS project CABT00000000 data, contig 2.98 n=2 Tax=Sordaria macrospora TaxID=5147 RepID=F7WC67_SORMK|nr:uncharacterized protein SMAC_09543 [Sordaria macrospora k-hell]KAA8633976.1 hypothetical protein SMACR_09543 [Sordaria macrospora]WPJ66193.1 hypothetical protein SMAC4_09543 [Sordaria macrospora]CCC05557.1 unnamed protein product [Sordaria macrospora k-hell]
MSTVSAMASAPALFQPSGSILGSHTDRDIVAQAFAFHRMLAPSKLDRYHDEFDEEDDLISNADDLESPSSSPVKAQDRDQALNANTKYVTNNTEDVQSLSNHPVKAESQDTDFNALMSEALLAKNLSDSPVTVESRDQASNAITAPVFAIMFHHRLIKASPRSDDEDETCTNSAFRSDLWVTEPKLGLSALDMGLLSQLAQICVHANIKDCRRQKCLDEKAAMDRSAPRCNWTAFREWALVTMSCQAAMSDEKKVSRAHSHIATVISCLCKIFKECRLLRPALGSTRFRPYLDGDSPGSSPIDLAEVSDLTYWMIKIQSQIGVGPAEVGRWNHHFLPSEVTLPDIERAVQYMERLPLCKNRLWNFVGVSDRKQSDLPAIVSAIKSSGLDHREHESCTPSRCQSAHMDSTKITQLHKCGNNALKCTQKKFPVDLLETALEMGNSTAWLCKTPKLSGSQDPYIAISHVWSDGTGVGLKDAGTVNTCLFDFFAKIAGQLECTAVWWDALSIPNEPKARSKALNMMHSNYANARHTVVHDNALINFPWDTDGSPCVALVLSTWFTRGWTALELSMSKSVKILFKNPNGGEPIYKDLDTEVLAQSPGNTTRAHWLATTLVNKLRQPVRDVGDLLAILSARSTSWVRDRTVIAALLAGVPDCDFTKGESEITIKVLQYLGKIPYFCLLHGKPTMRNKGAFSWCAATLDDMPVDTSVDIGGDKSGDLLAIDESGAVDGHWYCHTLDSSSVKRLKPYGNDLAAVIKINVALSHWERCLLLHPSADRLDPLSLLVTPLAVNQEDGVVECRYIGTVVEDQDQEHSEPKRSPLLKIRMGVEERKDTKGMNATIAISKMTGKDMPAANDANRKSQSADGQRPATFDDRPKWLDTVRLLGHDETLGYPTEEEESTLNTETLFEAIRTRRKKAALYLVNRGVTIDTMDSPEMFQKFGSNGHACASMKILGDVYAEAGKFEHARMLYQFVLEKYQGTENANLLQQLSCKYELATIYARAAQKLSDDELQYTDGGNPVHGAKVILNKILEECDRRARLRGEADPSAEESPRTTLERRKTWDDSNSHGHLRKGVLVGDSTKPGGHRARSQSASSPGASNSTSARPIPAMDQSEEPQTIQKAERLRDAQKWYRLELNAIADLTLLLIGMEKFDEAARTFQKAFRRFGSLPDLDVEGFSFHSAERDWLDFEGKTKHDEQAAQVYQRALKRFDNMFQGDHLLIFFTSLHLGVNYLLRSRFSLAEKNLMRAFNGFASRLSRLSPDDKIAALSGRNRTNEHIIIRLTRYHLGVLFKSQNKWVEAEKHLQEVRKIAVGLHEQEGRILELSAIHELGMIFAQRLRREQKAEFFISAGNCFKNVSERAEKWMIDAEVCVNQPRSPENRRYLQAMRHLYFRSFDNLVLLGLHHVKPHDKALQQAIQQLNKNLDQYGGDKHQGAANTKNGRKISEADEFEARRILGQAYTQQENLHSAEAELRIAQDGYMRLHGKCHLGTLDVCDIYADILVKLLERRDTPREDPEKLLEESVETYGRTVGLYHPRTLDACLKLGQAYLYRLKLEKAEKIFERAYHGCDKISGSAHLMTARAARLLGDVYFEKGTLGKAKDMYSKAYAVFSTLYTCEPVSADSQSTNSWVVASATKIETLQATMDYAKVCARIPTTIVRKQAIDLYNRVIKDFSALEDEPLVVIGKSIALIRLGALYGEMREFGKGRDLIEDALKILEERVIESGDTSPDNQFRTVQGSIKESLLEGKLKLVHLKLSEHQREENHTGNIEADRLAVQNTHEELVTTLGEICQIDTNTLNQQDRRFDMVTVLDQLADVGSHRIYMLTLEAYTALGELYMADHADSKLEHSPAQGALILTKVLKNYGLHGRAKLATGHPKKVHIIARLIAYYERKGLDRMASELNLELWDELEKAYGLDQAVLMIDATRAAKHAARCAKYDEQLREDRRKSAACSETSSFETTSPNYHRNGLVKEECETNDNVYGASPRSSSHTVAGTTDRGNSSQRRPASMGYSSRPDSFLGDLKRSEMFPGPATSAPNLPLSNSAHDPSNNFQRHPVAGPRKSELFQGPSMSAPNVPETRNFVPPERPLKRATPDSETGPEVPVYAPPGSSAKAHDPHYDGSQKKMKFSAKLKEAKLKLKDAGKEIKAAGKIFRR